MQKYGYMLDSPDYNPHFISSSSITEAISSLEFKFPVKQMARLLPDKRYVEIWEDKGIERKDMSFEDLGKVYRLYPDSSGRFICNELCEHIWKDLCPGNEYIDSNTGLFTSSHVGFSTRQGIEDAFEWLDSHYTGGVKALIYGFDYKIYPEPYFVPCEFVSFWDGYGDVVSSAKFDPVHNEVYDIEVADLSDEDLEECGILGCEYMDLLGSRFCLDDCCNGRYKVQHDDPFYVISGRTDLSYKPSLTSQIQAASAKGNITVPTNNPINYER